MQSRKSGKRPAGEEEELNPMIVTAIRRNRKRQVIVEFPTCELKLSENAFSSFPCYVGKEITPAEIRKLTKFIEKEDLVNYGTNLLLRGSYSSHEVKERLLKRDADESRVDEALFELVNMGLLNDSEYARDYAESMGARLYGKELIRDKLLYEKRVSSPYVDALNFKGEADRAKKALKAKEKSYAQYPYKSKVAKLDAFLMRRGFDKDARNEALSLVEEDPAEVRASLEAELLRAKKRYERKLDGYDLKEKIVRFLLGKGYRYADIEKALERKKL